jgi:diaminopimelate epimerase
MRYFKMNGCGNEFVIIDARSRGSLPLSAAQAQAIADRNDGLGCDQVIAVERSIRGDAYMRIWNANGGEVDACGNATRCVAWLLMEEGGAQSRRIETPAGILYAERRGEKHHGRHGLAAPALGGNPGRRAMDTIELDFEAGGLDKPGAVNMGNPHVIFFVNDVRAVPIDTLGPKVEHDPLFPQKVNVGFAEVRSPAANPPAHLGARRGADQGVRHGRLRGCGRGHRQGRTGRQVEVLVDGGSLEIEWRAGDDRVLMTGPIELEATGELPAT